MDSFTVKFYEECLREAQNHPNGSYTVLYDDGSEDIALFTVYPGTNHEGDPGDLGFGGSLFAFKTSEGKIILSNNCWHRGFLSNMPEFLKDKFEVWTAASKADVEAYKNAKAASNIVHPATYPDTPYFSWVFENVEQVVATANADDAKFLAQVLYSNGIAAWFHIPEGYKEIPHKHYEGDGLLSEEKLAALQREISNMVLVGG